MAELVVAVVAALLVAASSAQGVPQRVRADEVEETATDGMQADNARNGHRRDAENPETAALWAEHGDSARSIDPADAARIVDRIDRKHWVRNVRRRICQESHQDPRKVVLLTFSRVSAELEDSLLKARAAVAAAAAAGVEGQNSEDVRAIVRPPWANGTKIFAYTVPRQRLEPPFIDLMVANPRQVVLFEDDVDHLLDDLKDQDLPFEIRKVKKPSNLPTLPEEGSLFDVSSMQTHPQGVRQSVLPSDASDVWSVQQAASSAAPQHSPEPSLPPSSGNAGDGTDEEHNVIYYTVHRTFFTLVSGSDDADGRSISSDPGPHRSEVPWAAADDALRAELP